MTPTGAVDVHGHLVDAALWPLAATGEREAFTAKVFLGGRDECWIFVGGIEPQGGYGRWRPPHGTVVATHRWSFRAQHGDLDEPIVRHTCDVRCCVNPYHLEAGTQAQNIRDTVERGAWRTSALPIWPERAFRLRDAALAGDRPLVNELVARPRQLRLFETL